MTPDVGLEGADDPHPRFSAVRGGIVSRHALFRRLEGAGRITQMSAPAGSGKTFLLRSWLAERGLADIVAWVSIPDQDPQRFWVSVADALRGTTAGSTLVRPLTEAPGLDGWAIVERLLEDLGSLETRAWLVLDDVHELDSKEALSQLELLILRAPPTLRVVLSTRRDLRLGLHRLRLEGEVTEIRAADLRFSLEEARDLFQAAGVQLPEPALAALMARTEGWVAGLRLAALSLAGHPDPERFAAEFSGSERTVAQYLLVEVLERQPEEVRRLLLRTSVLERVSGELADLLTGDHAGERILQDLEESGAFVVALDARRSWFRYHHLFAELLHLQLRRTAPDELAVLHGAAAGWFAAHGFPVEAVRHAQAAQAWDRAASLLADYFLGFVLSGQGAIAHELLARFPADAVADNAELAALMAGDEVTRGSLEAAERYMAYATRELESVPLDRRGRLQVMLVIWRLFLARGRGDGAAGIGEARRLLAPAEAADAAQLELGDDLRALALVSLGAAEVWALRPEEAERHLEQGAALASRIGRPWLEITALAHGAWTASFRSFSMAVERGMQAIGLARRHGWTEQPVVVVSYGTVSAIRIWQMRLEEAEESLSRAERALRAEVEPAAGTVLCQARGMLELARGRDTDALAAFQVAGSLTELLVTEHLHATPMQSLMLQTLVRLGETGQAEDALTKMGEIRRGEIRNALAVLRLAQGDPQAAATALAPVLDGSAPVTNLGWMTQAFVLEAIARDALGDPAAAMRSLEHALDLAEPDRVVFAFRLNPAPELLKRCAQQGTAHAALISDILAMLDGSSPAPPRVEPDRLREPLTGSEMHVLRFLPTNLSAPEIAGQLSLSVNTVRTHMRHVYAKLGVHGRTKAVERARALGLLAPSSRRTA
jgi:LuxR family transcriptional regulator, maltose regulon positive regulatory protein